MSLYKPNDDAIGNHLEAYGYYGWEDMAAEEYLPDIDEHEDNEEHDDD